MKETNTYKEIEVTLASLDSISKAKAPANFLENLEARLAFVNRENSKWVNLLKMGVAAMIVMSFLNGYLLFSNNSDSSDTGSIEDFTSEYFSTNSDLIDF